MKRSHKFSLVFILLLGFSISLFAHCQIPCGIYGDQTRFTLMREHVTTIEKSMKQINELSKNSNKNINQLVRWVNNKDKHADLLSEIVTFYFLAQRVKITDEKNKDEFALYQKKLTLLHEIMVFSMKCKQTTDISNVDKLKLLIDEFENIYFSKEDKKHLKEHHK